MQKNQQTIFYLKVLIHIMMISPIIYTYSLAIKDQLGGDPVEAVIHFTGISALNVLLITLTISPLAKKLKRPFLLQVRRLVGLYAFTYALLHISSFLAFEVQFDLSLFFDELIKRPYIFLGMTAFILLFALAVTSFQRLKIKMGKSWQTLHSAIYLIVLLVVWHFYWSVKSEIFSPLFYLLLVCLLLAIRKQKIKKWLQQVINIK